jgi:hypothetical protein
MTTRLVSHPAIAKLGCFYPYPCIRNIHDQACECGNEADCDSQFDLLHVLFNNLGYCCTVIQDG